ncbi:MAG: hypothetical protein ACTSU7_04205 [Candidatus Heimdallarchaeaceae archaeon]
MELRNQSQAIKNQTKLERDKASLELINRQLEWYGRLESKIKEQDQRRSTAPFSFIREKFIQADVKANYRSLAIEDTFHVIDEYYYLLNSIAYRKGVMSMDIQKNCLYKLGVVITEDYKSLLRKRAEILKSEYFLQ